MLLDSIVDLR